MSRPIYLRRGRPSAWQSARFRDGLFIGFLAGVIACGLWALAIEGLLR